MSVSQARASGCREAISGQSLVRALPNRRGSGRAFSLEVTTRDGAVIPLSSSPDSCHARPLWKPQDRRVGSDRRGFGQVAGAGTAARLTRRGPLGRRCTRHRASRSGICERLSRRCFTSSPTARSEIADGVVIRSRPAA